MSGDRRPAVAGMFYPGDPGELATAVDEVLADAAAPTGRPKALIAPHAGYPFSGPVAASAYAELAGRQDEIRRVVLLGPAHRVPLRGIALPTADRFLTPLGPVPVDTELRAELAELPTVVLDDRPHAPDTRSGSILPFLQRNAGQADVDAASHRWWATPAPTKWPTVLERVWWPRDAGGRELRSEPLPPLRRGTRGRTGELPRPSWPATPPSARSTACGAHPVAGLLEVARRHDLGVELLDLRSSGDTAGPRDRVVGYGSFALS
ncbi:MAG: AmmeMemoRadiSam system protein B [Acidimicrobiia bacterium]|nr:AmmeMemoRadiSam system protein B [Acidimicrobiia bacterium]